VTVRVTAPNHSGDYFLQWDLVQEGVTWFSAATHQLSGTEVHVTADASAIAAPPIEPQPLPNTDVTLPPRTDLWQAALRMWSDYPLLGVGPDNFRHLYGPYLGLSVFNDTVTTNNLYLENLTDLGLIGALALGLFIYKLIGTVRKKWPLLTEPSSQILAVGLLASLATFFIHGLVDTFLAFTSTYGLFWLLSGLLVSLLCAGDS
jgi:O-antigen ligase